MFKKKLLFAALFAISATALSDPYALKPRIPDLKIIKDDPVLFQKVIKCYPSPSLFDMKLDFQAGYKKQRGTDFLLDSGWQDNSYVGIVMSVPLYSTKERFRALHEESQRRETLAKDIAKLNGAIARSIKAEDMYQLFKALEVRASVRVKDGYTPLEEQVKYIEKAAKHYESFMEAQSDINASITNIAAFCTDVKRQPIIQELRAHVAKGGSLHKIERDIYKPDNFKRVKK